MRQYAAALRAAVLLVAAACAGGRPAAPELAPAPPALIPAPLAAALIEDPTGPSAESREIVVGKLPPGFPDSLVPPGPVQIVGGMVAGREINVVFADSTRRLAAVAEEQFERAGYARPREHPASGFSAASGRYRFFCRGDAVVSATPLAGAQRHHVRVRYSRVPGAPSWCERFSPAAPEPDVLELPALTPPPGAHVYNSGGGGRSGGVESYAKMSGLELVPAEILAHYAKQLVAAGWAADAPAVSARVAAQHFAARTAGGEPWEGVLVASGSGSALDLSLIMKPGSHP